MEVLLSVYAGASENGRGLSGGLGAARGTALLIVWDRLPGHRGRLVHVYLAGLQGWIRTAYLPPYAPELNPVEYIWGYWKQHELPNFCPKDYWQQPKRPDERYVACAALLAASLFMVEE